MGDWIDAHFSEIKQAAEATTSAGKLVKIGKYIVGRLLYLRSSRRRCRTIAKRNMLVAEEADDHRNKRKDGSSKIGGLRGVGRNPAAQQGSQWRNGHGVQQ